VVKVPGTPQLLNPFRFCPTCSSAGISIKPDRSIQCSACGFNFFFNTASSVVGLIEDDQARILLTVRAYDPQKGTLDLPGGFVDFEESAEDALRREIREELNLSVSKCSYFVSFPNTYTYDGITYHTLDLAFICLAESLDPMSKSDEIESIRFFPPKEIRLDLIGFDSIRNILFRYMQFRSSLPPCALL
jgi:NADH pyrophosphatase NudC (nudix superfamily)